jgi:hypothetical protein
MNNTISDWNKSDYVEIYTRQLKQNPLWYDPALQLWVACGYRYCKALLLSSDAHVPEIDVPGNSPLNQQARMLIVNLVRINNGFQHRAARGAAMFIWQRLNKIDTAEVLQDLLAQAAIEKGFDFVDMVAKKLPIQLLLRGLTIEGADAEYIAENLPSLIKVMLPVKTEAGVSVINPVVERVYAIAERYVIDQGLTGEQEQIELMACNLVGLFIQCYDGGRGLLCNALLNLAAIRKDGGVKQNDSFYFEKLINETLRLHAPVHNTRRVATNDIRLDDYTIKAGETILLVLAAANLDESVFNHPIVFDLNRGNSDQHLTFGVGGHNCLARYFSVGMAADACRFLAGKYHKIDILQSEFIYEAPLNVRLVKQLITSFSNEGL